MQRIRGTSKVAEHLRQQIERIAPTDARVLILGENGTGKELVAAAIHDNSLRKDRPFVTLNCAAVPSELIESELFGHEKGAYTGADRQRIGRFEQANGGTLFLDEVGDMPPSMQAKLLRVLQDGVLQRLGGKATVQVDVRVLAATNRDLHLAIASKRFRQDLFYRLAVLAVHTPPLRERLEDIPLLMQGCFERSARPDLKLSAGAALALQGHTWPGNVRELLNVAERLVVLAECAEVSELEAREALAMDRQFQVLLDVEYEGNPRETTVLTALVREQAEATRELAGSTRALVDAVLSQLGSLPPRPEMAPPEPAQEATPQLQRRTRQLQPRSCDACGLVFAPTGTRQKYCSPTCRSALTSEPEVEVETPIGPGAHVVSADGRHGLVLDESLEEGFIGVELVGEDGARLGIPRFDLWSVDDIRAV